MKYRKIKRAVFVDRPNRFIAHVVLDGQVETVHVKNTGRCRELLLPGVPVILEESGNLHRKTKYDLVCVKKQDRWINMDSQIPNKAVREWLEKEGLFGERFPEGEFSVYSEKCYGNSRFDFYLEAPGRRIFMEVKGVTLEEDQTARFPDAPTERGVKHVEELIRCVNDGYEACLFFVIQMKGVRYLEPNWKTHEEFGKALVRAKRAGVRLMAYDCLVTEDSMEIDAPVPVFLGCGEDCSEQQKDFCCPG